MQGMWIDYRRPKSKKEVIETVKNNPGLVSLEATSVFGNEYDGPITEMPEDKVVSVVGPDPYTKRNFYLSIIRHKNTFQVK